MAGTLYPNSPLIERMYQKTIVIQEYILFKLLKLKKHDNNIGIHFYLPIRPFQLFGVNLYFIRLNFIFPFFVSFSIGFEGYKGFHCYAGLKVTQSECIKFKEWDYMISTAFRYNYLAHDKKWNSMGAL